MRKPLILISLIAIMSTSCNDSPKELTREQTADIVLDNIAARKSVRSYTPEQVPDEMIEKLLRAAMAAPSAKNQQPWEFIVVRQRETLDSLAAGLRYAKMLKEAPLAIVVCARKDANRWEHDASAATENLLLAAEALGLGAVWTAADDEERASVVIRQFGLPEGIWPLCVVPIGFPAGENHPKDKWNPAKIHYEKW